MNADKKYNKRIGKIKFMTKFNYMKVSADLSKIFYI